MLEMQEFCQFRKLYHDTETGEKQKAYKKQTLSTLCAEKIGKVAGE